MMCHHWHPDKIVSIQIRRRRSVSTARRRTLTHERTLDFYRHLDFRYLVDALLGLQRSFSSTVRSAIDTQKNFVRLPTCAFNELRSGSVPVAFLLVCNRFIFAQWFRFHSSSVGRRAVEIRSTVAPLNPGSGRILFCYGHRSESSQATQAV